MDPLEEDNTVIDIEDIEGDNSTIIETNQVKNKSSNDAVKKSESDSIMLELDLPSLAEEFGDLDFRNINDIDLGDLDLDIDDDDNELSEILLQDARRIEQRKESFFFLQ